MNDEINVVIYIDKVTGYNIGNVFIVYIIH